MPVAVNDKRPYHGGTMKLACWTVLIWMLAASAVHATEVSACKPQQLDAYHPGNAEIRTHRTFSLPVVSYPYGTKLKGESWGVQLTVRVNRSGQIVCWLLKQPYGIHAAVLNTERRSLLVDLSSWQYMPFARDHHRVAAIVTEQIAEQELPKKLPPPPDVPLDKIHIALSRSSCFGFCPDYRVDVYGDGRVVYEGKRFVDVPGKHVYRIPTQDVVKLVKQVRALDIWSMRDSYHARITDQPGYALTLTFGPQTHHIYDYAGQMVGMPVAVTHFEDDVDRVSRADQWVHLSSFALDRLQAEGFKFNSRAGADLLARSVTNNDSHDDAAMVRLIGLGAPVYGATESWLGAPATELVARAAATPRSLALVDALIDAGGLEIGGSPDQDMIDDAFQAAIRGGRLALVKRLWAVHGTQPHPSLNYMDKALWSRDTQRVPVTLLLSKGYGPHWEGLAIAKWLAAKGCDLNARGADGQTLLQIAATANDIEFVRYLLTQDVNPSAPAEDGKPALAYANDGDTAMILLQAGTDLSRMPDNGSELLRDARKYHWSRVAAWLTAHHVQPK